MKTFRTSHGSFDLSINFATVKRVHALTGVSLLDIPDQPEILRTLSTNPIQLVDVIYAAIKPQLDALGVTDEAFGESLDGAAIESATEAFLAGLVDFFPGARGKMLQRVHQRSSQWLQENEDKITQALADGQIDSAIDEALRRSIAGDS